MNPQRFNLATDYLPEVAAYLVQHLDAALICPETPVIDQLSQRVEDLESALLELKKQVRVSKAPTPKIPPPEKPQLTSTFPAKATQAIGENWYSINDSKKVFRTKAIDVTVESLRALAQISEQTLVEIEKMMLASFAAKKKKVIKRRWIARSREALYNNPTLHKASVEIIPGWWLGTNYSNGDKREMLALAAQVAQKFAVQLEFHLE